MDEKESSAQLIEIAVQHLNSGNLELASRTLFKVIELEPRNETAWLLLSRTTGNPDKQIDYLKIALDINPDNQRTKEKLARLQPGLAVHKPQQISEPKPPIEQKSTTPVLIGAIVILTVWCVFTFIIPFINEQSKPQASANTTPVDVHSSPQKVGTAWVNAISSENCTYASTLMQPGFENYPRFCDRPGVFSLEDIRIARVEVRTCSAEEKADPFFPCTTSHRIVRVIGDVLMDTGKTHEWYEVEVININGKWFVDEDWGIGPQK